MASFAIAYKNTGGHEGGWTVDNGGQTYQGISRKGWPNWQGWPLIDAWIRKNGQPRKGQYFNAPAIDNLVPAFYKTNYWDKIKGDQMANQTIANFIYDFYVNSNSALLKINSGLGASNSSTTITSDSLRIINTRPAMAYSTIYAVRKNHYTQLAAKPALKKYARGWFSRLEDFPTSIAGVSGIGVITSKAMMQLVSPAIPLEKEQRSFVSVYSKIMQMLERLHTQFSDATLFIYPDHYEVTYNNGMGRAKLNAGLIDREQKALNLLLLNAFKGKVVDKANTKVEPTHVVTFSTAKKAGSYFSANDEKMIDEIVSQHSNAKLVTMNKRYFIRVGNKRIEFDAPNDKARRQLYNLFMDAKIKYA